MRQPRARSVALLLGLVTAVGAGLLPLPAGLPRAAAQETTDETVVGELVRTWPEHASPEEALAEDDGPLTWVEPDEGEAVRLPSEAVASVPVGATVDVTLGGEVQDTATVSEGLDPARDVLGVEILAPPPTVAPATATHDVTVVLVKPAGGVRDSATLAQVVDLVNGPVRDFWHAESGGTVTFGVGIARDWIDTVADCANPTALWDEVASAVGFTPGPRKHLMLYVTSAPSALPGCSYGLAEVGGSVDSGGRLYVRDTAVSLVAHELGHNMGLGHSSAQQCDGSVESGTCRTTDYRDFYDVMGYSWDQVGSLNAPHAHRLRMLPSGQQATVASSSAGGVHRLSPMSARSGTRAIRLVDGVGTTYWLEYRTAAGQDAWLGTPANTFGQQSGVLLRRASGMPNTSLLLDGTPSTQSAWGGDRSVALPPGRAVPVAGGVFTVTVEQSDAAGATVRIGTGQATTGVASEERRPVGELDGMTVTGSTLTVSGWAVDPDAPTTPVQVHVYVGGRGVPLIADRESPGSLSVPGAGDRHGFTYSVELPPGTHNVCAFAIDLARVAGNGVVGCRTTSAASTAPTGAVTSLQVTGRQIDITGWAQDADAPDTPIQVHVYVNGRGAAVVAGGTGSPDGPAALLATRGFRVVQPLPPGRSDVCVYAIDPVPGRGSSQLTCQQVTASVDAPIGAIDEVSLRGSTVTVRGWAYDPDAPDSSIQVHVYASGRGVPTVASGTADLAGGFADARSRYGYTASLEIPSGTHKVCAYALDVRAGAANTLLGCRTVAV